MGFTIRMRAVTMRRDQYYLSKIESMPYPTAASTMATQSTPAARYTGFKRWDPALQ
jgi:hypothetical protein